MIELILMAQLVTSEPIPPPVPPSQPYQPPKWQQQKQSAPDLAPASKQIEDEEERLFETQR